LIIYGINTVKEALLSTKTDVEELILSAELNKNSLSDIIRIAQKHNVPFKYSSKNNISKLTGSKNHQGIAAKIPDFKYTDISILVKKAKVKEKNILFLILDHIQDPQNLGAIIRSANVLGVDGVIIPKDRSASVTPSVIKASSGATNYVPIVKVVNLSRTIRELKDVGLWVVGADVNSKRFLQDDDFRNMNLALVIGNEGKGLSKLIKNQCDFLVTIPNYGNIDSLNASVAAGIMIYECIRWRHLKE